MQDMEVEIASRQEGADGIVVLDLVPLGNATLPAFEPGAHVDVFIAPGLVRQYSLCGDPAQTGHYRLAVLLDPASRGGSAAIHGAFHPGNRIRIGLPRNNFPLAGDAAPAVLLAGGIGVTPLLAMAHHLHAAGRPFSLHCSARSRSKAAFLDSLAAAPYASKVTLHFDDAGQPLDPGRDIPQPDTGAHLYVCGPLGFMDWVTAAAKALGYDDAHIHREYFGAAIDAAGDAFTITLASSGHQVAVAAGQSVVDALKGAGIRVDVSCEQGICGTCLCTVLEGVPDHRDSYLTDDEKAANDQMTLCCSRARTPTLVLDL